MKRISAAPAVLAACLATGCAHWYEPEEPPQAQVVRTRAPVNYENSIANFYDLTLPGQQKNRELQIGTPERGNCPMSSRNQSGHLGWVVPVQYKTKSPTDSKVTITSQFFWFSAETIKGVTRRMELCP